MSNSSQELPIAQQLQDERRGRYVGLASFAFEDHSPGGGSSHGFECLFRARPCRDRVLKHLDGASGQCNQGDWQRAIAGPAAPGSAPCDPRWR